jgi:hypothetical protein
VRKVSNLINWPILILVGLDLLGFYVFYGIKLLADNDELSASLGYSLSPLTAVVFFSKIALYILECSKISSSYDVDDLFSAIKNNHNEKPELVRVFNKRHSLKYRVIKPVALFMFSLGTIIYGL